MHSWLCVSYVTISVVRICHYFLSQTRCHDCPKWHYHILSNIRPLFGGGGTHSGPVNIPLSVISIDSFTAIFSLWLSGGNATLHVSVTFWQYDDGSAKQEVKYHLIKNINSCQSWWLLDMWVPIMGLMVAFNSEEELLSLPIILLQMQHWNATMLQYKNNWNLLFLVLHTVYVILTFYVLLFLRIGN